MMAVRAHRYCLYAFFTCGALVFGSVCKADIAASASTVRIGAVVGLEGDSHALAEAMRAGLRAAFATTGSEHRVELVVPSDPYSTDTLDMTRDLIDQGVFAMAGNVAASSAGSVLSLLADEGVPAVGLFSAAEVSQPAIGDVVNLRASFESEASAIVESALAAGMKAEEICAYVQNDSYGMAGVSGIRHALRLNEDASAARDLLARITSMEQGSAARNNIGPLGVYEPGTLHSRVGFDSIKHWERSRGVKCKLVVSVGTYRAIARFAAYSRYRDEGWTVSAVSFAGAETLRAELESLEIDGNVILTRVTPPLDSPLAIVREARVALKEHFSNESLDGFIVGKLILRAIEREKGILTHDKFIAGLIGERFDIGGFEVDFTSDNAGSGYVVFTMLDRGGYRTMARSDWTALAGRDQ